MSIDHPSLVTPVWHTQDHTTFAITAHQTSSQKHVQFKLPYPRATSATMPPLLDVELPSSSQKSGFITAPSVSTAASTASNHNFVDDDVSLLARLQGIPIYALPGP
jgi:hypothetical protein